ncbi:metaxin-3-like [Tropilaelaps mercedesae]|uniref:Metaxin-3-like n=1 Tax=Tropilaelaps mercedesae TaxID=418985 RepID=A0A1V9XX05_9ACAR|nr:metaxin-3-like [Tropilaelaps mercedesae]
MELTIWRGEWGLGSVSIDCLETLAYCKFANALNRPVHRRKYIFSSDLRPVLWNSTHGETVVGTNLIAAYLKEKNVDLDQHLSNHDRADILAYKTMVQQKFMPALNYSLWCDERNYADVVRPAFARIITFPMNYTIPGKIQRKYLKEMSARFGETANPHDVETRLNREARECLMALSQKLGTSLYIFGNRVTSFDAFLFARLCHALKVPVTNGYLTANLKVFPNLVEYVNRIHTKFIAGEVRKERIKKRRPEWVGFALSISFAATVMIYYAIAKGILHIEFEPDNSTSPTG